MAEPQWLCARRMRWLRMMTRRRAWRKITELRFTVVVAIRRVHHNQPLMHIDLRGRKPNALACIHGLDQVIGQLPQCTINMGHGLGLGAQARVGVLENY